MACLSSSLSKAVRCRHWLLITATLENFFFSALPFGWTALLFMLRNEGFFEYLCDDEHANQTIHNSSISHHNHASGGPGHHMSDTTAPMRKLLSSGGGGAVGCSSQEKMFNILYTAMLFGVTGATLVLGSLADKYGYKPIRLVGTIVFALANFAMVFITPDSSVLLFPVQMISGLAGIAFVVSCMQIANLYKNISSTVLGVLFGAFASCALIYSLFKTMYDVGMDIRIMWVLFGAGGILAFINCLFMWPSDVIPTPEELHGKLAMERLKKEGKGKENDMGNMQKVGEKLGSQQLVQISGFVSSKLDLSSKSGDTGNSSFTLVDAMKTPIFLLGLFYEGVVFLRILVYMGSLHLSLIRIADQETVSLYVNIFGYMQIICIVACPLINLILDWGIDTSAKPAGISPEDENERQFQIKIRKLKNCLWCFLLNCTMLIVFGVVCLIPILQLQILAFITHIVLRGTAVSAVLGMYAVSFPFGLMGKLLGLATLITAVNDVIQSPIFIAIEGPLNGDPYYVDVGLFILSFTSYFLPLYLFFHIRHLRRERAKQLSSINPSLLQKLIQQGEPYAVSFMKDQKKEMYC